MVSWYVAHVFIIIIIIIIIIICDAVVTRKRLVTGRYVKAVVLELMWM
jgi:hypothetical protein